MEKLYDKREEILTHLRTLTLPEIDSDKKSIMYEDCKNEFDKLLELYWENPKGFGQFTNSDEDL